MKLWKANLTGAAALCALWASAHAQVSPNQNEARKNFASRCGVCHGADAQGTERGPSLAGARKLRSRSLEQFRSVIRNGIADAGMPPFDLPSAELDALASFVRSLNLPAAERDVPGDRAAGERFFFGKGRCASCHMVHGKGKAIGPDLSDTGRELLLSEIEESLENPSASITPGYGVVSVVLPGGRTLRGFARDRS